MAPLPSHPLLQERIEGHGAVVLLSLDGVHECHGSLGGPVLQKSMQATLPLKLEPVPHAELVPSLRAVAEPLPQFGAGGENGS